MLAFPLSFLPFMNSLMPRLAYNLKKADFNRFRDLSEIPWNCCFLSDDIEYAWSCFKDLLLSVTDQCIQKMQLRCKKRAYWFSKETLPSIRWGRRRGSTRRPNVLGSRVTFYGTRESVTWLVCSFVRTIMTILKKSPSKWVVNNGFSGGGSRILEEVCWHSPISNTWVMFCRRRWRKPKCSIDSFVWFTPRKIFQTWPFWGIFYGIHGVPS